MDWLSAALVIYGIYLIGKKRPIGFMIGSLGTSISIALQMDVGLYGLAFRGFLIIVMSFWSFYMWTKKKSHNGTEDKLENAKKV